MRSHSRPVLQARSPTRPHRTLKIPQARPDDSAIRGKVMAKLDNARWTRPALLSVTVQDGIVDLWGIVDSPSEKKAVHVLAEVTPGVRAVHDNLMIRPVSSEGWM
jgi:osmotically-inducible protein OsmY